MKKVLFAFAALAAFQPAYAQERSPEIACLTSDEMSTVFQTGQTSRLPNYSESVGARVQRQHPDTALLGQAKFIDWEGKPVGFCQYSNHVGIVANFILSGATADASDGACDDGSCVDDSYWRSEWTESSEAQDRPGKEQIYVCMQDIEGADIPSLNCRFARPTQ